MPDNDPGGSRLTTLDLWNVITGATATLKSAAIQGRLSFQAREEIDAILAALDVVLARCPRDLDGAVIVTELAVLRAVPLVRRAVGVVRRTVRRRCPSRAGERLIASMTKLLAACSQLEALLLDEVRSRAS
jgi:hypothetical protein